MLKKHNKPIQILALSPIFGNFLFNLFQTKSLNINLENLLINNSLTVFLFIFLICVGKILKKSLNLNNSSLGILIYLFSFLIFDYFGLIFSLNLSFFRVFTYVNIIWLLIFLYYFNHVKLLFNALISYLSMQLITSFTKDKLIINKNIIGDVADFQYSNVQNIYEKSYYYSLTNPSLEGYPQALNYIQALLNRLLSTDELFTYFSSSSNVYFLLSVFLFYEFKSSQFNFLLISFTYSALIFNSDWLNFLFLNSLMAEGLVSYLLCVTVLSTNKALKNNDNNLYWYFLTLGMLYLTKEFVSSLGIVLLIIYLILFNKKKFMIFGFSGVMLSELSHQTSISNITKNYHFKQFEFKDFIFDIVLFRNLEFVNLNIILKNLLKDRPLAYLLFIFFLLLFIGLFNFKTLIKDKGLIINILVLLINISFIAILYISIWKNMELESPIRYILNSLHLLIITTYNLFTINTIK